MKLLSKCAILKTEKKPLAKDVTQIGLLIRRFAIADPDVLTSVEEKWFSLNHAKIKITAR